MNLITTTELRTKMPEVIVALLSGESIDLIHRSRMVGKIIPDKNRTKIFTQKDFEDLQRITKKMNLPKLSQKQMEKNYKEHMMNKYGKGLS